MAFQSTSVTVFILIYSAANIITFQVLFKLTFRINGNIIYLCSYIRSFTKIFAVSTTIHQTLLAYLTIEQSVSKRRPPKIQILGSTIAIPNILSERQSFRSYKVQDSFSGGPRVSYLLLSSVYTYPPSQGRYAQTLGQGSNSPAASDDARRPD